MVGAETESSEEMVRLAQRGKDPSRGGRFVVGPYHHFQLDLCRVDPGWCRLGGEAQVGRSSSRWLSCVWDPWSSWYAQVLCHEDRRTIARAGTNVFKCDARRISRMWMVSERSVGAASRPELLCSGADEPKEVTVCRVVGDGETRGEVETKVRPSWKTPDRKGKVNQDKGIEKCRASR